MSRFKLVEEDENYREREIATGESLEEILEMAGEKAGRESLWEAIDEL